MCTMERKEMEVFDCFGEYKTLPPDVRAEVIRTAQKIMEIQKENRGFLVEATDPSAQGDGGKGR